MLESCRQLLIVVTTGLSAIEGTMIPYSRNEDGDWSAAWSSFPVVVGRNGMALDKREGDGCSPIGCFPLVQAFGNEPGRSTRMPYLFTQGLEGVDDPSSRYYNRLVRPQDIHDIDWKSSEKMDEMGPVYDWGVVVGYNWPHPRPHAGSCIFLHIWSSSKEGTAGCTAMAKEEMQRVVEWLDPACNPRLLQCPKNLYGELLETEHLPVLRIP